MSRQPSSRFTIFALFTLLSLGALTGCQYEGEEEDEQQREQAASEDDEVAEQQPDAAETRFAEVDISDLVAEPGEYEGRRIVTTAPVQQVVSDNLFFVGESEEERLLVGFGPDYESPEDVTEGMSVGIRGEMMTSENATEHIAPGVGDEARTLLEDQDYVFVVTKAGGIEVLERAEEGETAPEEEIVE